MTMLNKDGEQITMKVEDKNDVKELNKLLSMVKLKQEKQALTL